MSFPSGPHVVESSKFTKGFLAFLAGYSLLATPAHAGTIICSVGVSAVSVSPQGTLIPNMTGLGWPYLCNVQADQITSAGTISPQTCQAWVAMFTTALATEKDIVLYISYGAAPAPSDCESITDFSWQIPAVFPYFLFLEN